jgi:ribonuclease E
MAKRMLIDATHPEETRVAVVDGRRLEEFDVEVASKKLLKGNIYLAKITRVEPSLQAAFVEYGGNRHGFLAFSEIHPDYYRIPVEDREALLAEQAALAREEEEQEEAAERRRHRRPTRGARPAAAEAEEEAQDEEAFPEDAAEEASGPEEAGEEPSAEDSMAAEASGEETSTGHVSANPADDLATGAGEPPAEPTAAEAPEGPADGREASGEVVPLRVTGGGENRLSGDLFEGSPQGEPELLPNLPAEIPPAPSETNAAVDEAPAHHPVIEDAPVQAQPLETIGGDEAEEPSQRRPRPISRRYKIQDVIKRRQIILVQVTKEERGNKGAALTTYLSLAGRYCVLMPNTDRGGGVSRKITNAGDRKRLKSIIDDLELPAGMAVIVRTAGSERSKPEVKRDFEYLLRLWDEIRELTLRSSAPALIYEEANLIKRAIRDLYTRDIEDIQVEGDEAYRAAKSFMRMLMPSHAKRVQQYKDPTMPLFTRYQIESQLDAIHNPTVQLRSGGYIVINQTEALVAIDVNSGRATRERNIEETALKTNLEAADEIARQLRLRDLAGLIVIDFIDMDEQRHNGQVERRLKEAMRNDRARIQLGRISPFGLLELSRQRLRPSLFEASTEVCRYCRGTGHVRSTESTALHVLRSIEEEGARQKSAAITVSVPGQVALFILNHKRQSLAELEARQALRIYLAADDSLVPPDFRIERIKALAPGEAPPAPVVQSSAPAEEPEAEEASAAASAEAEIEAEDEQGEEQPREARLEERREGRTGEGGERRRGRRRRRRGRDRDHDRDRDVGPDRGHDREPRAQLSPANPGIPTLDGGSLDDSGEDSEAAAAPAEAGETAPAQPGDPNRRRRRRGRRGGRRRRRDGEPGGEARLQENPAPDNGDAGPAGIEGGEQAGQEAPALEETAGPELDSEPAPIEAPYALHVTPAPEPAAAEPEPEPAPPAEPAATPEAEESKSGTRKRGWWQRVLS